MLFNSYIFIFIFFPLVAVIYYVLIKYGQRQLSKLWLVLCSLFFYSWWNYKYIVLLVGSILINYSFAGMIWRFRVSQTASSPPSPFHAALNRLVSFLQHRLSFGPKHILVLGILFNVSFLFFFKYADFFITNINYLSGEDFSLLRIALPLGISFFTLQQIAFLVDASRGEVDDSGILNYSLFVSFFPQLVAGPIVHHKEMMPQFLSDDSHRFSHRAFFSGLYIFSIGLFKKVVIADTFSSWSIAGFDHPVALTFFSSWAVILSYSLQLYFDFSAYSDMAIGLGRMLNIELPVNFNSPYKALSLQDFWRRWHMTLSRWIRDYIYFPLGGSRRGDLRTYFNLIVTFTICGIWHGAGWTFVFWGLLHGLGLVLNRLWRFVGFGLPGLIAWFFTFLFVSLGWVLFRAPSLHDALRLYKAALGGNGFSFSRSAFDAVVGPFMIDFLILLAFVFFFSLIALFFKNSISLSERFRPSLKFAVAISTMFIFSLSYFSNTSEFLYFNF
jgi:alginate O-acetyltransferase complex protein AlgI